MSAKLPKSIRIAGQTWKVVTKHCGDDAGDFGETDPDCRTIWIYTHPHEKHGQSIKSTFLHECIHAALAQTGTSHVCAGESGEEAIVTALEGALWPLIKAGLFR